MKFNILQKTEMQYFTASRTISFIENISVAHFDRNVGLEKWGGQNNSWIHSDLLLVDWHSVIIMSFGFCCCFILFEMKSCYVAQAGLELRVILLSKSPKC